MPALSAITREHLDKIRSFYDAAPVVSKPAAHSYRKLLGHYYNLLIPPNGSVLEIGCGSGELLDRIRASRKVGVDLSSTRIAAAQTQLPDGEFHVQAGEELALDETFDCIIANT